MLLLLVSLIVLTFSYSRPCDNPNSCPKGTRCINMGGFIGETCIPNSSNTAETSSEFESFVDQFGKQYSSNEYSYRRQVFHDNYDMINNHNSQNLPWKMSVNEFTDLTPAEFKRKFMGLLPRKDSVSVLAVDLSNFFTLPASVDWRKHGVVTPVKNQQQCGSCWSFSASEGVESAWAIKTGKLLTLSEQQLMDCSHPQGDDSCEGGWMDSAFDYIIANKGICTESSYPYRAVDESCRPCKPVATISSYVDVPKNNEAALQAAVALQPVSIAVDAEPWQFYSNGILPASGCGTNLDHGVQLVGYATAGGSPYWLVRNSWGASWGENGYIRLEKGAGGSGTCGLTLAASYPVV